MPRLTRSLVEGEDVSKFTLRCLVRMQGYYDAGD